jgi:hypothetical protein
VPSTRRAVAAARPCLSTSTRPMRTCSSWLIPRPSAHASHASVSSSSVTGAHRRLGPWPSGT